MIPLGKGLYHPTRQSISWAAPCASSAPIHTIASHLRATPLRHPEGDVGAPPWALLIANACMPSPLVTNDDTLEACPGVPLPRAWERGREGQSWSDYVGR